MPIELQKNIYGRIFRAQVKKVEKDKIQAHLIDVDEKYDSGGTAWFPFATIYSSGDGSGWYVMPEVDDYVRILFPSIDTKEAFASSSINTAPLKEAKGKIQMVSQKEIIAQSGQSHMKILANQIDMGGSNIIVGE